MEGNEPLRGELESMVNWEKPIENVYRSIRIVFNVVTSLCIFFCLSYGLLSDSSCLTCLIILIIV